MNAFRSFLSFLWSCVLWSVFTVSLVGTVAGARLLQVNGTQKQLVTYGSIVVSLWAGSRLAKREPLKSILASRKVQWFLFLFNGAVAVAAYYLVGGAKGIGAAIGMGLVSLGAGVGLLKRPHHQPRPASAVHTHPDDHAYTYQPRLTEQAANPQNGRPGRHRAYQHPQPREYRG
ncbi:MULTISPECIES: hypothetical protein [unclassified Pseudofrankia]|uniref:hypothetical protein n=1 Tax=unclassified Pseudofrankia TaxID=2994372 RepID=UPI0008DACDEF|nr:MULTISPECIES: hypothetical protein [unclassified Pseudofrankia]MDT3440142.1 hypothetical protein [Pseudofrankia sp. BMG5.37]OHV59566.1 hypothetical protein BCD48_41220 [Pseudofrankia sp. BMG5.36]